MTRRYKPRGFWKRYAEMLAVTGKSVLLSKREAYSFQQMVCHHWKEFKVQVRYQDSEMYRCWARKRD